MRKKTQIVSLYGEIEVIIANQMMAEGKGIGKLFPTATVSSLDHLPETTRYNAHGQPTRMVIVVPGQLMIEFERRVEDLRL
jgi:hypothetical protein